jgi:hypothetical protein
MPKMKKRTDTVPTSATPKQRKTGYKFNKLVHKNVGKVGSVSLGSKFTGNQRALWAWVMDYCLDNFPPTDPARKREHVAMVILEAACETLGLAIPAPAAEPRNDNQLNIPGTEDGIEHKDAGSDDPEGYTEPDTTDVVEEEVVEIPESDDEESAEVSESDEDGEILPLEETV